MGGCERQLLVEFGDAALLKQLALAGVGDFEIGLQFGDLRIRLADAVAQLGEPAVDEVDGALVGAGAQFAFAVDDHFGGGVGEARALLRIPTFDRDVDDIGCAATRDREFVLQLIESSRFLIHRRSGRAAEFGIGRQSLLIGEGR